MADDAVGYGARVTRKSGHIRITQVNCSKNGESCPVRQIRKTHTLLSVCGWESIILTFSIHVTRSVSVQSHSQSLTESQKEGHTRRFKLVILPNLFKFMWGQVRLPSSFKLKTWAQVNLSSLSSEQFFYCNFVMSLINVSLCEKRGYFSSCLF